MDTQSPTGPTGPETFLHAASRIGQRLVDSAQWTDDSCTWTIMAPDRANPGSRRAVPTPSGGTVYEGTAGIALFLAELYAVTRGEGLDRAALGAVRHALNEAPSLSDASFGYHAGRPGVAYVTARVGELLARPELYPEAEGVIRPLAGNEARDQGMDVIAGGGGAIPALLRLTAYMDPELPLSIARAIGEHLIAVANRDADGWSWNTMRNTAVRNLNGYAHGAAGIGHGLLELYAATGDGRFRYAAEQAFLYERRFFDPGHNNWPDLRHTEIGEYQFEGRTEELRARLRGGDRVAKQPMRYMAAWCHGSPGIGLSRVRAYELLGDPLYLEETRASFESVRDSLVAEHLSNYSLCHGRAGNAETLLYGAEVLGEPELLEPARATAAQGIEQHEGPGRPFWSCGTMGGASDPGLLLGEAGIGLFLLRLARPEVPSAIILTGPDASAAQGGRAGQAEFEALRDRTVEEHFGRTIRAFTALGVDAQALLPRLPMGPAPRHSDTELAYAAFAARIEAEADPERRDMLADAFALERARYDVARAMDDHTIEFLESLARLPQGEVDWREGRVELSERARVVTCRWDWDAWLGEEDPSTAPEESDAFFLAQFSGGRAQGRRLSPFAALVLQTVQEPATLDEVIDAVAEAVSGGEGDVDRGWLEDRVQEQLTQAYRAGFITFVPGVVAASA